MAEGSGFEDGPIVVPFGTAPSNSGANFDPGSKFKVTGLGVTDDGNYVYRLRNPTDEDVTITYGPLNGPQQTATLPAESDLIVCSPVQAPANNSFIMDVPGVGRVHGNADPNQSYDPTFNECFAPGTPIATPDGERAVETLKAGDLILTAGGRAVPVKWIGRQTVRYLFADDERFCPVRIAAGALAHNVPHTDLVVTANHGIMIGEIMVNAGAVVNGTTITRVPTSELSETVTYFHIETEDHDVILAAGTPAETYIDHAGRRAFDNYDEFVSLYGEAGHDMVELGYPRAMSRRQVPQSVWEQLAERAAAIGAVTESEAA